MATANLEAHPAADLFPLIEGAEFDALVDDIKAHGQREPITLYEGKILDGRNRYRACEKAEIKPRTVDWKPKNGESPVDYAISLNLTRRHLDEGQRAMVGAKAEPLYAAEAALRKAATQIKNGKAPSPVPANLPEPTKGEAREKAAAQVNVSARSVQSAKTVLATGTPELVDAVAKGKVAVSAAAKVATLSTDEQKAAVAEGKDGIKRAVKKATNRKARARPFNVKEAIYGLDDAFGKVHSRWPRKEPLSPLTAWLSTKLSQIQREEKQCQ